MFCAADKLQADILKRFPNDVTITTEGTKQVTGFMEIEVNGSLVHSKKNGDGFVDTEAKFEKICSAIEACLK
ncbi:selT/selW/selH selenoprotein [Trichuris suis]|nr:selT/selW/selH selenoprotein [Trichuris suis]